MSDLAMNLFLGGEVNEVARWITPGSLVLDVGAHVGSFTLFAANLGAIVVAVEPNPRNCSQWIENVAAHLEPGRPRPMILWAALGNQDGLCSMRGEGSGSFAVSGDDIAMVTWDTLNVKCGFWADVVEEPIDLLKVDIEGSEYDAFTDADLSHVAHFVIETHAWTLPHQEPIPGVGPRTTGPEWNPDAYATLLEHLATTHVLTVRGDETGGYVLGDLR